MPSSGSVVLELCGDERTPTRRNRTSQKPPDELLELPPPPPLEVLVSQGWLLRMSDRAGWA